MLNEQDYFTKNSSLEDNLDDQEVNTGINIFREAIILQTLERRGVITGIPKVIRNKNGVANSVSTLMQDEFGSDVLYSEIVLEKIDGQTFETYEFTTQDEVVEKYRDIAKILEDIHATGFVHNDIKPENMMIDKNGNVYVIDFNLAATLKNGHAFAAGLTAYYAAPECRYTNKQDSHYKNGTFFIKTTRESDIYAFTVALAETLGLNTNILVQNSDIESAKTSIDEFISHINTVCDQGKLDKKLGELIAKNISFNPNDRCHSFSEIVSALR